MKIGDKTYYRTEMLYKDCEKCSFNESRNCFVFAGKPHSCNSNSDDIINDSEYRQTIWLEDNREKKLKRILNE